MNIAELIHDADHLAAPSNVERWAKKIGGFTKRFHVYRDDYPLIDSIDLLIVHGGAQHLWEKEKDPWLYKEIEFVKNAALAGIPVIGCCLGCQIIADAFGGNVFQSPSPETGFYTVLPVGSALKHPILNGLEKGFPAFIWHEDHFSLPTGFSSLALTDSAPNQIIAGLAVPAVGFQFHPEYTRKNIKSYVSRYGGISWRTEDGVCEADDFIREVSRREETHGLFEKLMHNALEYLNGAFPVRTKTGEGE